MVLVLLGLINSNSNKVFAQERATACANADFSNGDFTNWTGSTGLNTSSGTYSATGGLVIGAVNSLPNIAAQQTIMTSTTMTDPNTGGALKVCPPGGAYSVRLGNELASSCYSSNYSNPKAQRLEYKYNVTSANCIFYYQYAVVLQNPGTSHDSTQQPKFTIYVLNSSGALIDPKCGKYEVNANEGLPGYNSHAPDPALNSCAKGDNIVWHDWTTSSLDLTSNIGQTITVQFTTYDCTLGGHFGYAYISCYCGAFSLTQQCVGTSDVITAPPGYASYQWTYNGTTTTTTVNTITETTVIQGATITCLATASNGCTFTFSMPTNTSPPVFTPNSPTICKGQTATITATPATYIYSWSTTGTGATISVSPTSTTVYTVTASVPGGCSNTGQVTVTVNPLPTGTTTSTLATCGNNNGTITVSPTFNSYSWSTTPAQTTQTATGLAPGTYTVTVTDANTCTNTISGPVTSNSTMTLSTSFTNEFCSKSNGTATVTPVGGSGPPYTYSWNPSGQTTQTATGLAAGTYSVTVSDGVCPQTTSVTLINWPNPKVSITNVIPETCSKSNGGATAVASGGTGAITYLWNPSGQTTAVLSGVAASTYTVTITDSKGCTADTSVVIKNFPPPTASITNIVPSTCSVANGSITVTPNGGTGAYTYSWNTTPPQTTPTASNILGGATTYTVTVTDSVGCTVTTSGVVPNSPGPNITGITSDETCTGSSNGSVTINVTGGNGQISYIWSTTATTQNITGVIGGTYTVSVSDINGCSSSKIFVVPTHPLVNATATSMPEYCNKHNGSATAIGSLGDNGPYSYLWSNSQTSATITNLATGTYTVSVTDGHCATTTTVVVNFVQGPTAKIINATPAKCGLPNGSATVLASGGTSPYTSYLWSNAAPAQTTPTLSNVLAGTYTVTVTDSKGCTATTDTIIGGTLVPTAAISNFVPANCGFQNGSITVTAVSGTPQYTYIWSPSVQTTPTAAGVLAGTYTVTVTDAMGCTAFASGTVPQLPGPTVTAVSSPDICSHGVGTATATGAGGHAAPPPYSYFWNNGQTTQVATGLHEGNITVIVSDGGCTATASVNVGNIPGPNAAFFANPKILTVMDGPVSFIDESNGSVINWDWTLGDGSTSAITQFTHAYPDTGKYEVMEIITDTNNCKDTARGEIIVKDIYTFYVPNCFTPSGDSLNDWFYPQGINWDPNYFEMYIFDRWGNIMFRSLDINNKKWNGTFNNSGTKDDALMDVYVYLIRTKELNGPKHQYIGKVTLLK